MTTGDFKTVNGAGIAYYTADYYGNMTCHGWVLKTIDGKYKLKSEFGDCTQLFDDVDVAKNELAKFVDDCLARRDRQLFS